MKNNFDKSSLLLRLSFATAFFITVAFALAVKLMPAKVFGEVARPEPAASKTVAPKHFAPPSVVDPAISIIIDDIGGEWYFTPRFLEIDGEITYSVMPSRGHTDKARALIREKGRETMIHIPMQPRGGRRFKETTTMLWTRMPLDEIRHVVDRDIEQIPEAVGANNHMGSQFTRWKPGITVVLEELKKHDKYFVDSVTGGHHVAYETARDMGMRCYARDVFLDYRNSNSYVKSQLMELIEIAKKRGSALAICHPRSATYATLKAEIPRLTQYGVRLVPASVIVESKTTTIADKQL